MLAKSQGVCDVNIIMPESSANVVANSHLLVSLLMIGLYSLAGVLIAIAGYKLFDWCTPGDLHKEIVEKGNTAAAVVGAAIIIGVCIIVAASIASPS